MPEAARTDCKNRAPPASTRSVHESGRYLYTITLHPRTGYVIDIAFPYWTGPTDRTTYTGTHAGGIYVKMTHDPSWALFVFLQSMIEARLWLCYIL